MVEKGFIMKFWKRNTTTSEIRRIRDLLGRNEKIYIYLASERIGKEFLRNAEEEGLRFGEGSKPTQHRWSDVLAVMKNKTICYVGWVGRMRFHQRKCDLPRIDYERYMNGERKFGIFR